MAEINTTANAPQFPDEPASRWTPDAVDDVLRWIREIGASDLKMLPRRPIIARIDGDWMTVTRRPIQTNELFEVLGYISGGEIARTQVVSGADRDFGYEVKDKQNTKKRIRFRGYAMGCRDNWSLGTEITLRVIPERPPAMADIDVSPELYRACRPHNGLVLFTGITGTGKTTTMASMLADIHQTRRWAIGTYEQPVEFALANTPGGLGPLTQSEIPTHYESFTAAARSASRRALDLVLVGESRDAQTLDSMFELAEMGHIVYSTVHTQSVAATPLRIIQAFPHEKHSHASAAFFSTVRMVIQQRLVPKFDPDTGEPAGRIALREHLEFDPAMRSRLMRTPTSNVEAEVEKLVRAHGVPLIEDAREKYEANLIATSVMDEINYEYREREAA